MSSSGWQPYKNFKEVLDKTTTLKYFIISTMPGPGDDGIGIIINWKKNHKSKIAGNKKFTKFILDNGLNFKAPLYFKETKNQAWIKRFGRKSHDE